MARTAAARSVKLVPTDYPAPGTRDACDLLIHRLGEAQRARAALQTELDGKLATLKRDYEERAQPHAAAIAGLSAAIRGYCDSHREELLAGGGKTVAFKSGEVAWRLRPPAVAIKGAAALLNALKALGLERFIRTKEEVNKEAMLAEPAIASAVAGVQIGSAGEDFIIKPLALDLEEVIAA